MPGMVPGGVVLRAPVAQRIEQRFPKPRVVRSSRTRGTIF
jgi:hypothetical protein